jgi:hypothetical protein
MSELKKLWKLLGKNLFPQFFCPYIRPENDHRTTNISQVNRTLH